MPDSDDTRDLVAQLRAGSRAALEPLLESHGSYLRQVVEIRLGQPLRRRVGVSDVVQATHVDALEKIEEYLEGEPMPFRWWLRKTVHERLHRTYREHLQAAKRDMRREVPLPDRSSLGLAARLTTPSRQVARRELAERVRQALARLPDTDREILLMRTFEELPYEEIGYVLQIQPATARKRHGRALLRLDELLRKSGVTESEL